MHLKVWKQNHACFQFVFVSLIWQKVPLLHLLVSDGHKSGLSVWTQLLSVSLLPLFSGSITKPAILATCVHSVCFPFQVNEWTSDVQQVPRKVWGFESPWLFNRTRTVAFRFGPDMLSPLPMLQCSVCESMFEWLRKWEQKLLVTRSVWGIPFEKWEINNHIRAGKYRNRKQN